MTITDPGHGLVRRLGIAAAAMFAVAAASQQRSEALSLVSPGAAPSAKHASDGWVSPVRAPGAPGGGGGGGGFRAGGGGAPGGFHGGGGFRGGGAAFHGGGFRGGGIAAPGGGFRAAPVFRGGGYRAAPAISGGYRYSGYRAAYYRPYFHRRHYFHRRFYAPVYYDYPRYYAYPRRYCRVIWTYYGPRKICRYRPFHRHHWRHHRYRYGYPFRYG